jgi:hypothetical protein
MKPAVGQKLKIAQKCICEHFKHERANYPREGHRTVDEPKYTFMPGEEVFFVNEWSNFYGTYYRVTREEGRTQTYDLNPDCIS